MTHGRAARLLVAPVEDKLGTWQAEAVKLEVMVDRLRAAGRRDPAVAESTRALLGAIAMQAQLFEAAVAEAPPMVREHSRVADARKVLGLLVERLTRILAAPVEPPNKAR